MNDLEQVLSTMGLSEEMKDRLKEVFVESVNDKAKRIFEREMLHFDPFQTFQDLMKDTQFRKLIMSWDRKNPDVNRAELLRSFPAAFRDLQGNTLAEPLIDLFMSILQAIVADPTLVNRLINKMELTSAKGEEGEEVSAVNEDVLVEQVERYATYVAEEFLKENKLQLESGVKVELAEEVLEGIRNVLSHYGVLNLNEDFSLLKKIREKERENNILYEKNVNLHAELKRLREKVLEEKRNNIFMEKTRFLPRTQVEKIKKLESSLVFEDSQSYADNLETLIETVITFRSNNEDKKKMLLNEEIKASKKTKNNDEEENLNTSIEKYIEYFDKTKGNVF